MIRLWGNQDNECAATLKPIFHRDSLIAFGVPVNWRFIVIIIVNWSVAARRLYVHFIDACRRAFHRGHDGRERIVDFAVLMDHIVAQFVQNGGDVIRLVFAWKKLNCKFQILFLTFQPYKVTIFCFNCGFEILAWAQ